MFVKTIAASAREIDASTDREEAFLGAVTSSEKRVNISLEGKDTLFKMDMRCRVTVV